jgi:YesN/AraC family two-component response regulator
MDRAFRDNTRTNILNVINREEELFCYHMECDYLLVSNYGTIKNAITGKIYKTSKNSNGYDCLNVVYSNGKRISTFVHRLVADTFLRFFDNSNYIFEVNHIDGNKNNNHVTNLEWVTRKENLQHSRDMRLAKSNDHKKFSRQDIDDMIELYKIGFKLKEIAKSYNGSSTYISKLMRGKIRKI